MTKRLNTNINEECAGALSAYAAAHGVTVTEAVRHAISLLNQYDVQTELGNRLAVVDGDGLILQIWTTP